MERFLNIDWKPSLDDIINNTFISDERLEKESVMHKIITGTFTDPFKDIDNDYNDVDLEILQNDSIKSNNKNESDSNKDCDDMEEKPYVPGIVKHKFKFPKRSRLTQVQQAMCLRILLRFSEPSSIQITPTEKKELEKYTKLRQVILNEQEEYLEFAKSKWPQRTLKLIGEEYINLFWKSKLQYIHKLPRYYSEFVNVPFVAEKKVVLRFVSECLQLGTLPKVVLPKFTAPCVLYKSVEKMKRRFPPKNYNRKKAYPSHTLPVSEDRNCHTLAETNGVDLVISSSGLNCLVNNIGPSYANSWILPVVVKAQNGKNVVYIDKPAPPRARTIPEKNTWFYKYVLKSNLLWCAHPTKESNQTCEEDNLFDNNTSDEILRIEEESENTSLSLNGKTHSTESKQDEVIKGSNKVLANHTIQYPTRITLNNHTETMKPTSDYTVSSSTTSLHGKITNENEISLDTQVNRAIETDNKDTERNESNEPKRQKTDNKRPSIKGNASYKLFTLGPESPEQHEILKNAVTKEYKMLVRTKTDGYEELETGEHRLLLLAPKLEHQIDLGAEAVTSEEALRQWISLTFRPQTYLARVRIMADTSEATQIEYRTAESVNNEIKRLYNMKVEDSLTIFHNIIQFSTNLSPGRYVMGHTLKNGTFAVIYKETGGPGKNIFDLHTICDEIFHSVPNPPWLKLDKTVVTPMQKCFGKMPGLFIPLTSNIPSGRKGKLAKVGKINIDTGNRNSGNK